MSVNFSNFTSGATPSDTDQVVGYTSASTGGERRWTVAKMREALITGAATTIDTENLTASRALVSDASGKVAASDISTTKLNYLTDVTSNIQAQLDNKRSGTVTSVTGSAPIAVTNETTTPVISIAAATQSAAGIMSSADKTKLDGLVANSGVPAGAVMAFAMTTAPTGWIAANGDTIPNGPGTVQGKTADFSALYSLIGTTYGPAGKLPDLRGYFVRGNGTNSDGTESGTFGAKQADEFKRHNHTVAIYNGSAREAGGGATILAGNSTTTSSEGGTETRPRNIAMLYCIKY